MIEALHLEAGQFTSVQRMVGDLNLRKLDHLKLEFSAMVPRLEEEWNHRKVSKFSDVQKAFTIKQELCGNLGDGVILRAAYRGR
ncbi:MAG: hypothetical protein ACSHX3_16540 [Litorimonas sp.]